MSIEINHLSFLYAKNTSHEVNALRNICVHIEDGEFVGIMGRTGCGKSTFIQLIAGLLKPSEGQIFIDGEDINDTKYDRKILRKKVGIVFQYPEYQLFETTVEKDVAFALKYSGMSRQEVTDCVKRSLELVGFDYEEIRSKSPLSLSGGEKRRVAIAGVLAAEPDILIFDEPIAGLDPYGRQEFLGFVAELNRAGKTVLMISHNTDCLCEYAGRLLILKDGELIADGTPNEIFSDAAAAQEAGIGIGNVRYLAQKLYERGITESPYVTKYHTLREMIRKVLSEKSSSAQKGGESLCNL